MTIGRKAIEDAETIDGGDIAKTKILTFITKHSDSSETMGDLDYELFQKGHSHESSVGVVTVKPGDDYNECADEILELADEEARQFPGKRTKFVIRILSRPDHCGFQLACAKIGDDILDDDDLTDLDDQPTKRGLIAQTQRHQEVTLKLAVSATQRGFADVNTLLQDSRSENRELRRENRELTRRLAEMSNISWIQDMERKKLEGAQELRKQLTGGMLKVGAMGAAHFLNLPPTALLGALNPAPASGAYQGQAQDGGAPASGIPPHVGVGIATDLIDVLQEIEAGNSQHAQEGLSLLVQSLSEASKAKFVRIFQAVSAIRESRQPPPPPQTPYGNGAPSPYAYPGPNGGEPK